MRALPFLCTLLRPCALVRPSAALLRSTVLELAILTAHVLIYPTGMAQERRPPPRPLPPAPTPAEARETRGALEALETREAPDAAGAGDTPGAGDVTHLPVLLLHGFIDNRSVFVLLRRSLLRHGWRQVWSLNYSPLTCDIRTAATLLARHVEEVCAGTGHERVDMVGHSLGGLVARYYIQRLGGDARVRTLVTLGTPHGGTRVAPLMSAHPLVRQMRPDSDVIAELAEPAPHCATQFIGFWSDLDQIMVPVETARIDHPDLMARNVRVSGVGHLALPVHGAVAAGIRQALTTEEAVAGARGAASVA
ncbi:esterase/lipase family protein [Streptomyces griseocarneus]|uniref:esterase/lipase family protein n=1 Tax=Streptomyces griseocarneus TaxID=51201 RepID=UPI00167E4F5D|nr:alpha/beta fold hydrolase [Streptomyces griseocarneus]MBZ6473871.1 alpha/beta fold hydrolase [Streptomyces griseocarneus]GHG65642.1 lipase [Streptomyces griseocarneus]